MPIEVSQAITASRRASLAPWLAVLLAGRSQVTLEIGCGHGHFLTAYAATHPGEFCVAIDIIAERLERAERKSRRAGLTNLAWVLASAEDLLACWPVGVRFGPRIFILFPDPWPKRRHWKNRLMQAPFLTELAARSAPGAQLCFRTDHGPYFEAAATEIGAHPDWETASAPPWPFELETVFQARAPSYRSWVATRAGTGESYDK